MKHYDEKSIELYLLGSDQITIQREEMRQHLTECASCRELHDELAEFYKAVHGTQPMLNEHIETVEENSITIRPEYHYRPAVVVPRSIPSRMWQFARRRPIVSSFSGSICWSVGVAFN